MTRIREMARHAHFWVLAGLWLIGLGATLAAPPWVWALVPVGIALQYLNEYSLHRFIFHLPPPRSQRGFDLLYQAHYGHHDFPTNRALFFAPWWVIAPVLVIDMAVVYGIGLLVAPALAAQIAAAIVLTGGIGTFLSYEWFHMTAHLSVPKTRVERHVTTLHNQHHFRDFNRWFHVSPGGEVIDRALGTAIDREALKAQQRVAFIRTLGLAPDDPRLMAARRRFATRYGLSADEIARAAR